MADLLDETQEIAEDFDPASLPLGTFTAFDVSDQPMYTTAENAENKLNDDQKNAIKAMVDAVGRADAVARRIEVQSAWMLELLDRGFHRLIPTKDQGWQINGTGTGRNSQYGVFGANVAGGWYDTNVIGEKNDTIVSLLTREIAESTFFATRPGDPDDETYAAAANCLKHFIAEDNKYGTLQASLGRLYCTDETAVGYTRPVADAQKWGYEDVAPDVVPETADGEDPNEGSESDRPKIRTLSEMFGKLCRKVPVVSKQMKDWMYCGISSEYDIASQKSEFPWIASNIKAGDLGIAELKLDRLARQSINLSLPSSSGTGDSLMRDVTKSRWWMRPGMYMDESCPKSQRAWFWETFPKGFLVVYSGDNLAFARNESMDEVLTEFHARSGNGQNRRALTESYASPQMRVNVLVDLWDEFCRKEIPRVGLDAAVWNVPAIRASTQRVGAFEPFQAPDMPRSAADTILPFPTPTHTPTLPDFIMWLTGPLAEQLTHAPQGLAGSQDSGDPEQTATESKLKQNNAMSSFGESWKNVCAGFANMTTQAVSWNARVQPEEEKFDTTFSGRGRLQAQIKDLKMGSAVARADGSANFPESWDDRQRVWNDLLTEANTNPASVAASFLADPRNIAAMREFLPKNMILPGVDAVEKQQGEFDILLKTSTQDNPQYLKLQQIIVQGMAEVAKLQRVQQVGAGNLAALQNTSADELGSVPGGADMQGMIQQSQ